MSLHLLVGVLAGYEERDSEDYQQLRRKLDILSECFAQSGLGQYREPENCDKIMAGVGPYRHLHYLRRVAAYLAMNNGNLPPPGDDNASKDPCIKQYVDWVINKRTMGPFDHLITHSDCDGYYLPLDFNPPLSFSGKIDAAGEARLIGSTFDTEETGLIGSTFGLLRECEYLATALQIPIQEFDLLFRPPFGLPFELPEGSLKGNSLWKKYRIESHVCTCLLLACRHSIKTGAALLFA